MVQYSVILDDGFTDMNSRIKNTTEQTNEKIVF